MKSSRFCVIMLLSLTGILPPVLAENKPVPMRPDIAKMPPPGMPGHHFQEKMEMEKVTMLGVETSPVSRALSTQLGLPKDTGLVVTSILEKSPAAEVLKEDDVLLKLDDQLLINMPQLGVLVRAKKDGDEVKLTIVRGGKELTVKTRLVEREMPKHDTFWFGEGDGHGFFTAPGRPTKGLTGALPGMEPDESRDVLRMIARERGKLTTSPRVHVIGRSGEGSTILDLPGSNIAYADDEGTVDIKMEEGKRTLTIKNAKDEVVFDGPINTPEERAKLSPELAKRLEKLEHGGIDFEAKEGFRARTIPLPPPGPGKTKIRFETMPGEPEDLPPGAY